jgi:hypothetical protein
MNFTDVVSLTAQCALVLARGPLFHLLFHKGAHSLIHRALHHIPALHKIEHHFKFLPDCMMLACLVAVHFLTEGHEAHTGEAFGE